MQALNRFTGLRRVLRNVIRVARPAGRVRLRGQVFRVPRFFVAPTVRLHAREVWLDDVLAAALRFRRGTVVDVGVNVGQTLLKIASLDPNRRYVGFEPNLSCCYAAEQLIDANGLSTYSIVPIGLSNEAGVHDLMLRGSNTSAGSVVPGFRPAEFYSRAKPVYLADGDAVFTNLNLEDIGVVKLDVEGAELEVLEGMRETLRRDKPLILFEVLPHFLIMTGETLDEGTVCFRTARVRRLEQLLRELGYGTFLVRESRPLERVEGIEPTSDADMSRTNYLAIPIEHETDFLPILNTVREPPTGSR